MKKVWLILLAVVLAFGLVIGCGGNTDDDDDGEVPFEFTDFTKATYNAWGNDAPTITDDGWVFFETVSGSSGFYINFADIGYTLNRTDTMVISYAIDVTTPNAVLLAKVKSGNNLDDAFGAGAASSYGRGGGREYVLDDDELSNYEVGSTFRGTTAIVEGTYDAAAKTGTFEIKMSQYPASADNIAFQHNVWCDMADGTTRIAEDSVYKIKFTKMENKVSNELLAPVISTQPAGAMINLGEAAPTLTVAADDPPAGATRAYQWQKQDEANWVDIANATGASLALTNLVDTSVVGTHTFRVVVSNVRGTETASINSNGATIRVIDPNADVDYYMLGDFTVANDPGNQEGWGFGGVDGDLDWDKLVEAAYLILETKGSNSRDGFGGLQIVLQSAGNSWGWDQSDIISSWISFANDETDTVYIVIDLTSLDGYSDFINAEGGKFFVCVYPLTNLGLQNAYLIPQLTKPEGATDLEDGYNGYITKAAILD